MLEGVDSSVEGCQLRLELLRSVVNMFVAKNIKEQGVLVIHIWYFYAQLRKASSTSEDSAIPFHDAFPAFCTRKIKTCFINSKQSTIV